MSRSAATRKAMGTPPRAGRWGETLTAEEQHQLRREVIFRTAARAFNESGFYTTTLDDIAARLNVAKPTLYYYVKSKEDILLECIRLGFAHMKEGIQELQESGRNGIEKLTRFLEVYIELVANDFGRCIIRTGLQPLTPASKAKLLPAARQVNTALQDIIRQGVQDGSIRKCDPKMVANAIFGSFNTVALWHQEAGELTPAEIASHYIDLFIRGLRP